VREMALQIASAEQPTAGSQARSVT
jgi:hypothetical protein